MAGNPPNPTPFSAKLLVLLCVLAFVGLLLGGIGGSPNSSRALLCKNSAFEPTYPQIDRLDNGFDGIHGLGFHVIIGEGSVRKISCDIDPTIWKSLGDRKDGADFDELW